MTKESLHKSVFNPENPRIRKMIKDATTTWKMNFFMLSKMPGGYFFGLNIESITPQKGVVSIPYSWWTTNPFKSIYFVAQAAAAEMSTAILAKVAMEGRGKFSMLVTNFEAEYVKKANTRTTFTCEDGHKMLACIQKAIDTGEGQKVIMTTVGRNTSQEIVSKMNITWSFKKK